MIISFAHKYLFVAVPKTGSQAVRTNLRPSLREGDWEQSVFDEARLFPVPRLAQLGHGHIKVKEIQPFLLPGMWQNLFSFAFVRNPFDRFVSFCSFYNSDEMTHGSDPAETMKRMIGDPALRDHVLLQPQHQFLEDENGDLAVSFIGRYESLHRDFGKVCEQLNRSSVELETVNASTRRPLARSFDRELEDMVRDIYHLDFEKFGYDRNVPLDI